MPLWEEDGEVGRGPKGGGWGIGFHGESGGWNYWVKSVRKFVGLFALGKGYT